MDKKKVASDGASDVRPRTVLVATTGMTPAVLTETVWALAHEQPPVFPDKVKIVTTLSGKAMIEEQLFGAERVWEGLRASLLARFKKQIARPDDALDFTLDDCIVVRHNRRPLDSLVNREQHTAFADAIMDVLWGYTSRDDGTRVIASLAGGYKTMSSLMLSAMQLLANPDDRVTHVLISGGYDALDRTSPLFFFPEQPQQALLARESRAPLRAAGAAEHIQLIDIPLIPLRRWFEDALDRKPPSYGVLVAESVSALQNRVGELTLELGPAVLPPGQTSHWLRINGGDRLTLSPDRYAYLRFFTENLEPFHKMADIIETFEEWIHALAKREIRFERLAERLEKFQPEDLSKRLNELRSFLKDLPGGKPLAAALPKAGRWQLSVPPEKIKLHN